MEKSTVRGRIARRKALRHRSLFLFKPSNSFRHKSIKLVNHASFEALILVSIVVSSCLIGSPKTKAIIVVDMVLNCLFLFEFIAKLVAYGLVLHPGAYLRDSLNILDASIVLTSFAASVKTILDDEEDLNLMILRLPRIFRPLRLLVVAKELRIVLDAIVKSSLALFHVAVFILLLLMLYAIVGLELFSGKLHHACHDIATMTLSQPIRACSSNRDTQCGRSAQCIGNWTGANLGMTSFDNIGYSLLAVFQIITLEDWVPIYYYLSDAMGSQWHSLYFVSLILFGAYFSLDLMLGVLTNQYIRTKDIVTLKQKANQASVKKLHSAMNVMKTWFVRRKARDIEIKSITTKPNRPDPGLCDDANMTNSEAENNALMIYTHVELNCCPKPPSFLQKAADSKVLFITTMLAIALNSGCLAVSGIKMSAEIQNSLDIVNIACNVIFFLEHLIKLCGNGFNYYLEEKVRLLDGAVVLLSVVDLIYSHVQNQASTGISIIRTLCLLRLFKGTKLGTALRKMQDSFIRSSKSIFSLLIVLLLTLFIYAMLGNHLFKNFLSATEDRVGSFASARESMLLVFVLLTGEGWPGVMAELVDKYWKYNKARVIIPVLYFLSFIVLGNFILLNIFLGIMIDNLTTETQMEINAAKNSSEGKSDNEDKSEKEDKSEIADESVNEGNSESEDRSDNNNVSNMAVNLTSASDDQQNKAAVDKRTVLEKGNDLESSNETTRTSETRDKNVALRVELNEMDNQEQFQDENTETALARKIIHHKKITTRIAYSMSVNPEMICNIPKHNSMFIFAPENTIRAVCYNIATSTLFHNLSLGSIVISTILLAFEDPLDRDPQLGRGLQYCDYLFTGIFMLEIIVKAIAFGLAFGHPACYLRDKLNIIDLIVTLLSLVSVCIKAAGISLPMQLKVLRVLRVLRILKISHELRYVVDCLVSSCAKIFNYFMLYLSLLFIYSVIGVKLYSGKLKECKENYTAIAVNGTTQNITNITSPTINTLNTTAPTYALYETTSNMVCKDLSSNFNHVLNAMITLFSMGTLDNWTTDMQAIRRQATDVTTTTTYLFVISFILVMTFIMLNVFVGFVAVAFQIEREKQEGFCILTKHAQDCIRMALKIKMEPTIQHGYACQRKLRKYLDSAVFEYIILVCVTLNCVIMMTKHHNQSRFFDSMQEISNLFFTSLFTVESLLKIFAMSPKHFVRDPWSVFDLLLVIGSWIDVTLLFFKINIYINLTVFRLFRAVRVFRVICKTGNLRQILATFLDSVKSVPSIVFLVVLVLFIYAVMGMQLFGRIRLDDNKPLNRQVHFQDFETALIVLLRTTTLDNWRELMIECSDMRSLNCIDAPLKNCGTLLSYPFFMSFIFLSAFMITNLFLAVIMDNFMYLTLDSSIVYCQHIHNFMVIWRQFDPGESGKIHESYVVTLLRRLQPPLGFGQHCPRRTVYAKLVAINVPTDENGKVWYKELLILMILYCLGLRGKNELVRRDVYALDHDVDIDLLNRILPIEAEKSAHSQFRVFCAANAVKYHFRVFVELLRKIRKEDEDNDMLYWWWACIGKGGFKTDGTTENGLPTIGETECKDNQVNDDRCDKEICECRRRVCCDGEKQRGPTIKSSYSDANQQETSKRCGNKNSFMEENLDSCKDCHGKAAVGESRRTNKVTGGQNTCACSKKHQESSGKKCVERSVSMDGMKVVTASDRQAESGCEMISKSSNQPEDKFDSTTRSCRK